MKLKLSFLASVVVVMVLALVGVVNDVSTSRAGAGTMPLPIQPFAPDAKGGINTNQLGQPITANWTITQALQGERTTLPWIFSGPGFFLDLDKEIKNPIDDDGDTVINDGCAKSGTTGEGGLPALAYQCANAVDDPDGDVFPDPIPDGVVNDGCPAVGAAEGPVGGFPASQCTGDYTQVGTVWTNVDAGCDGEIDYMAQDCSELVGEPPLTAGRASPLRWYEATTAVESDPDQVFLKAIMPPFSWLVRHQAPIDHLCTDQTGAGLGTKSVLNTVYAAIPYSPSGMTFVAQTKLGGSPDTPPSVLCLDSPQASESVTTVYNNPPNEGDIDGVCDPVTQACADAGIYGMWTDNTVAIANGGSEEIAVEKYKVNNGPEDGLFEETWEVESTNADIIAEWVVGTPQGPLYVEPVTLVVNDVDEQEIGLSIQCLAGANDEWGLVVLKNFLSPVAPTEDTYLDDNAMVFVVLVKCGTPVVTPEVDKEVALIRAFPSHIAPTTPGVPVPVAIDELKANHATTDVLGDEWLVAEVGDVDAEPGPDLILAWAPGVTVTAEGHTTQTPTVTSCGTGCIKFQVNEWPGQADVNATLNIACPATTPAGLYPVVVKAIDAPATETGAQCTNANDDDGDGKVNDGCPAVNIAETGTQCNDAVDAGEDTPADGVVNDGCPAVGPFESKASDNAQRKVITVRCGGAEPDGKVDGNGLYPRWTIFASQGSTSLARASDLRKDYQSPPSIVSDIGYVERTIDLQCFWIDSTGGAPADADGVIDEVASWQDPTLLALGGIGTVDADSDCLIAANFAQPGHPVDSLDAETGTDCPDSDYSEEPTTSAAGHPYDTAADQDCDGLVDGIEKAWGSNPLMVDSDGDLAPDFVEMFQFTNPVNPDTDGDGLLDKPDNNYQAAAAGVGDPSGKETGDQCTNAVDDDNDAVPGHLGVNDGCVKVGTLSETVALGQCDDDTDDDLTDTAEDTAGRQVNDGCPAVTVEIVDLDDNCPTVYNPTQLNTDGQRRPNAGISGTYASNPGGDKLGDACDDDNDNDGAVNGYETYTASGAKLTSDPLKTDTDCDTVVDGAEWHYSKSLADVWPACQLTIPPTCDKPVWSNSVDQTYYRGCHISVNGDYAAWDPEYDPLENDREMDPDGDGSICPTDTDSDNGGLGHAAWVGETADRVEGFGYGISIVSPDTDGDGCYDWVEIGDVNGDRSVDSGDQGQMNKRIAGSIPSDCVSCASCFADRIFDLNKDGTVDSGDQGVMNRNNCPRKGNWGGCPICPPEN